MAGARIATAKKDRLGAAQKEAGSATLTGIYGTALLLFIYWSSGYLGVDQPGLAECAPAQQPDLLILSRQTVAHGIL